MRKSPRIHTVQSYRKRNKIVHSYIRGHGINKTKIANPSKIFIKRPTLLDSRIQYKINELENYKKLSEQKKKWVQTKKSPDEWQLQTEDPDMVKFYQTQIDFLKSLIGKTHKQVREAILLKGDELVSARINDEPFTNVYNSEKALETAEKLTGIKYPTPKYQLAKTALEQHANIIGYKPESEKLVWMSPTQYLLLTPHTIYKDESSKDLLQKMLNNEKLDALWLDVDVKTNTVRSHEGRHRAKVAEALGIEKVPVILYAREGRDWAKKSQLPEITKIRRQE